MLQPYLGIGPTRSLLSQYYANGDQSGCWFGRHAHELAKIVRLASATVLSKHANNSVNTMTGSIPAALIINSYPASAQNMRLTYDRHNQCHIDHRAAALFDLEAKNEGLDFYIRTRCASKDFIP